MLSPFLSTQNMKKKTNFFLRDEEGLTTVEYAVAGALVAAVLVASFTSLGGAVATTIGIMAAAIGP